MKIGWKGQSSSIEQGAALSRRTFLRGIGAMSSLAGGASLLSHAPAHADGRRGDIRASGNLALRERATRAFTKRLAAARSYLRTGNVAPPASNGDELYYDDLRASFFKTLPQNDYGEVDPTVFRQLREALRQGSIDAIEQVPLSPQSDRGLANPLAARAYEMIGPDAWSLRMPPAPTFAGSLQAAEMAEVYWQGLTRDVPFGRYGSDPAIAAAVADLNNFSHRLGRQATITTQTLFRGETPGDRIGPYISQFLWLPAQWGSASLDQRFRAPLAGQDFGLSRSDWLAIQRGRAPLVTTQFAPGKRHIATGRDLAEFVHGDVVYQSYLTAALIALEFGSAALDPENPYLDTNNQGGFVTFGTAEIVDLVAKAAHAALKAAWFQKWLVHRRLRPEVFAARAEFQRSGVRAYGINDELFDSGAAATLLTQRGSLILPLAYPEGSPTHPSYPAGHAVVAGACTTMLKAVFNEAYEIPAPVEASADGSYLNPWTGAPLTLGGEFNKLASNISLGRDTAGVHYRSDGVEGLLLGETVALGILRDYADARPEAFAGFELTLFDGTEVRVGGDHSVRAGRRRHRWRRRGRFQQEY